ncbi:MAG: xanthine dehydrogenase family protein molybdopterin-binding subunit [Nitrososphaerota archaeon]|nr:xanthine dehydrogenase family protein molybdopterin-binding subunit [Nitrososphaerota archaeon]
MSTPSKFNIVGNPNLNRRDITRKITGAAIYAWDINPAHIGLNPAPGHMVYLGVVVCPYPRAKILSIDTSAAEAAGYACLTGDDLPPYAYASNRNSLPLPRVSDTIMYPGQPVVAVSALTTDGVEDAAKLVKITYEPLPYLLDAEEALAPDALQLYEGGNSPAGGFTNENGMVPSTINVKIGDADSAMAAADVVVGPVKYQTQHEQHYEMEPYAVVAQWTNGNLRVWSSNQWPHAEERSLASYFGVPVTNVTVSTALGGNEGGGVLGNALGDKISGELEVVTAMMAQKTGAVVKGALPRNNQATWMSARFPMGAYITMGAKNDGTITALKATVYTNVGAIGGSNGSDAISDFYNMYNIPNVTVTAYSANTNRYHNAGAMRDVGESQGHFFIESAVDELAQALNMDPVALRQMNLRAADAAGNPPVDPNTNFPYTSTGQPAAFIMATDAFGWGSKWKGWGKASQVNGALRRGVGIADLNGAKGSVSLSDGQLQVNPDGTVQAFTGLTDHGAGGNTTYVILAAEALGLTSFDKITLVQSDTSLTTDTIGTFGSRSTRVCGMAFISAAKDLGRQWFPTVAKALAPGTNPANLAFGNNTIYDTTNPSNSMSFTAAAKLLSGPLKGSGFYTPPGRITQRVTGTKFAEVEVNIETGAARVVHFTSAIGIGRVVFPKGAESQVRGGLFMGIGETLYQELYLDPTTGQQLNPNFHDFRIATMMESPDQVDALWVEQNDPIAPFGAVGIGEPVLMAVSPAIANALSNALGGYRFRTLPITREEIVAGIQWARANGKI